MRSILHRPKLLAAALASAAFTFAGPAAAQATMRVGFASINDVQHELSKRFAARMEKQFPGKLKIEIYPAEQLGSMPRMIEGLNLGTVEGFIGSSEFLVGVDPRYQIVGAPAIVTDMEHGYRLLADPAFRRAILSFGDARGVKGIGLITYGPNVYASRKPLRNATDFKGLKVRTFPSPMHTVAMEKVGATGVPMNPADTLIALSSGAMDANRAGLSFLVSFKYFDVVKFATDVPGDSMGFSVFVVGKTWYDKLPAEVQKGMVDIAGGIEREMTDFSIDLNRRAEETWKARGAELIRMGPQEAVEFTKRMRGVGDEVATKNPRIKEAYTLMMERAVATRR